jgi:hypothetical protein
MVINSAGMLYPYPQILDYVGGEWQCQTLAYYDMATIMAVKSFIVQVPEASRGVWTQTLDLGIMRRVFYQCFTAASHICM